MSVSARSMRRIASATMGWSSTRRTTHFRGDSWDFTAGSRRRSPRTLKDAPPRPFFVARPSEQGDRARCRTWSHCNLPHFGEFRIVARNIMGRFASLKLSTKLSVLVGVFLLGFLSYTLLAWGTL